MYTCFVHAVHNDRHNLEIRGNFLCFFVCGRFRKNVSIHNTHLQNAHQPCRYQLRPESCKDVTVYTHILGLISLQLQL